MDGTLPGSLFKMSDLLNVVIEGSNLKGSIPPELCDAASLEKLYLSGEQPSTTLHDPPRPSTTLHDPPRRSTTLHDTPLHDTTRRGKEGGTSTTNQYYQSSLPLTNFLLCQLPLLPILSTPKATD